MVKVTGLTPLNFQALIECRHSLPSLMATTRTTATFDGEPGEAAAELRALIASLPGRGHPKASLHAVLRKVEKGD